MEPRLVSSPPSEPNSARKLHEDKLASIIDSREPNKYNAVPHKKEVKELMQLIQQKRERFKKQHLTAKLMKHQAIMRENQILLGKLVEIVGRKTSICLPDVQDRKFKTSSSFNKSTNQTPNKSNRSQQLSKSLNGNWRK